MAGGKFAAVMGCLVCGARADRIYEGDEDDTYKCEAGHQFNVEWREPATEPMWTGAPANTGSTAKGSKQ